MQISWSINGNKIISTKIPENMRNIPLYPYVEMEDKGDVIRLNSNKVKNDRSEHLVVKPLE